MDALELVASCVASDLNMDLWQLIVAIGMPVDSALCVTTVWLRWQVVVIGGCVQT